MGDIIMNQKDQKIFNLSMEVVHGRLNISELSILINKSYRQSRRIVQNVLKKGMFGVKHGNLGKASHNKTSFELEMDISAIQKSKYYDFNLTHFREMLELHEGIKIGKNIITRIAHKNGMIKRPKRRKKSNIHKTRPRMPKEGMLVQFDGSVHVWFGNFESDLIGGIDDATGEVVGAEFFIGETSLHCMKVMKDIALTKGIPEAYYLDQAGYFGKHDKDQSTTQIGRALKSLNCNIFLASSAQAKGKIERLWNTFQDRLIAELRLHEIVSIPRANEFLKNNFLPRYNTQFSITPRESVSYYKKVPTNIDLENIFCVKESRKISQGSTFSWDGEIFIVDEAKDYRFRTVNINKHFKGDISFDVMGRPIKVKEYNPEKRKFSFAS